MGLLQSLALRVATMTLLDHWHHVRRPSYVRPLASRESIDTYLPKYGKNQLIRREMILSIIMDHVKDKMKDRHPIDQESSHY